jgi:hypothetical protein
MRINDTNGNAAPPNPARLGRNESTSAQETGAAARSAPAHKPPESGKVASPSDHGPDRLQLSSLAAQLNAEDVASPERTAHIDRLAAEFAACRYQPDADAISSQLIDEALGR